MNGGVESKTGEARTGDEIEDTGVTHALTTTMKEERVCHKERQKRAGSI